MGLAAGVLVKVMFDSAHRPFPSSYALLFALAFVALAMGWAILAGLREPVANAMPGSGLSATAETEDAVSEAATLRDSLHLLRRLLSDGGPFARLMGVQLLLGVPTLAAGLYTPFALGALRMPTDVTGIFVAATAVGAGVGGLCLPLVARRSGSLAILSVSAAAVVLAPPAFALASVLPAGVWLRAICCSASFACQGVANAGLFMGVNDLVLEMAPAEERTLYIGLSNTVPGLLVPLPVLGGVLAQWVGSAAVLWLCPLPALAGLAVLRNVRERPG